MALVVGAKGLMTSATNA